MDNLKNYFRKTISDIYYDFSKDAGTKNYAIIDKLLVDIPNELKKGKISDKRISYEKLFILILYRYPTKSFNFPILELMANSDIYYKKLGYILAYLNFENDENCVIMSQNIIKKDLLSPSILNKVMAIIFASKYANLEYFENIKKEIQAIYNNYSYNTKENHMIQQKSYCLLKKVIKENNYNYNSIIDFKKFLVELEHEDNLSLLVSKLSILEIDNPDFDSNTNLLYIIKPLIIILEKVKSTWIIIKVLKILNIFIHKEPRIITKIENKLKDLLINYNYKSTSYEIYNIILSNDFNIELQLLCLQNISKDLESDDYNLISLNLEILYSYIKRIINYNKNDNLQMLKSIINNKYIENLISNNLRPDLMLNILILLFLKLKLNNLYSDVNYLKYVLGIIKKSENIIDIEFMYNFYLVVKLINNSNINMNTDFEIIFEILIYVLNYSDNKIFSDNINELDIFLKGKTNINYIILNKLISINTKNNYILDNYFYYYLKNEEYINNTEAEIKNIFQYCSKFILNDNDSIIKLKFVILENVKDEKIKNIINKELILHNKNNNFYDLLDYFLNE